MSATSASKRAVSQAELDNAVAAERAAQAQVEAARAAVDRATLDPATGGLRPEMVPGSTVGGAGDGLHPNRIGYLAMAGAVDLATLLPPG